LIIRNTEITHEPFLCSAEMNLLRFSFLFANALRICHAQSAAAKYRRCDNYSVTEFDQLPGTFAPTDVDCAMMSTAQPASNGAVYNYATHMCTLLTVNDNEILVTLHVNSGYTTFVKSIADVEKLLVKFQSGISNIASDLAADSIINGTGGKYTTVFNESVASLNLSTACGCTYRNAFLDYWNGWQLSEVRNIFISLKN
jgi:hypothetical protein